MYTQTGLDRVKEYQLSRQTFLLESIRSKLKSNGKFSEQEKPV